MPGPSEAEIGSPFEDADLALLLAAEELSTDRDGERGKLGIVRRRQAEPAGLAHDVRRNGG